MSLVLELLWGCIAGLVAAVCMTIFELPFWKNWGMEGVAEWQVNSAIVSVIIRKFTHRKVDSSMSVAMHLFHGAALGIVFRVLLGSVGTTIPSSSVLIYATVYSGVLWIISPILTRPSEFDLRSYNSRLPTKKGIHGTGKGSESIVLYMCRGVRLSPSSHIFIAG